MLKVSEQYGNFQSFWAVFVFLKPPTPKMRCSVNNCTLHALYVKYNITYYTSKLICFLCVHTCGIWYQTCSHLIFVSNVKCAVCVQSSSVDSTSVCACGICTLHVAHCTWNMPPRVCVHSFSALQC